MILAPIKTSTSPYFRYLEGAPPRPAATTCAYISSAPARSAVLQCAASIVGNFGRFHLTIDP